MIKCVKMYSNNYMGYILWKSKIQQLIIQTLEEKGYAVTVESDGIYVDDEDITTSIKISVEVIP